MKNLKKKKKKKEKVEIKKEGFRIVEIYHGGPMMGNGRGTTIEGHPEIPLQRTDSNVQGCV